MAKKMKKKSRKASEGFRATWQGGLDALSAAEAEVRRLVSSLMRQKGSREARKALEAVAGRLEKERKRAEKELLSRARSIQARIQSERKAVVRFVHEAVQGALATLNIPSRAEIVALTRKVDELSRKVQKKK